MAISTEYGESTEFFGHKDYYKALEKQLTNLQIKKYLDANMGKLRGVNVPGSATGVYELASRGAGQEQAITRQREAEQREIERQREAEQREMERLKQMEIGQRTQAANTARAGFQSKFQIGSSSRSPQTAGTQGFKRRQLQVNPTAYKALSSGASSTATLPGVLNV
tara:strand:+ start:23 stop:520 length:498 start_codon:yes stop_codon:yes gene_type:complete